MTRADTGADVLRAAVRDATVDRVVRAAHRAGMLTPSEIPERWRALAVAGFLVAMATHGRLDIEDRELEAVCAEASRVVPELAADALEALRARELTTGQFGDFLASAASWPGLSHGALALLAALRPDLADVLRERARHLGRPDPLVNL
jgi:hypothetical protein